MVVTTKQLRHTKIDSTRRVPFYTWARPSLRTEVVRDAEGLTVTTATTRVHTQCDRDQGQA